MLRKIKKFLIPALLILSGISYPSVSFASWKGLGSWTATRLIYYPSILLVKIGVFFAGLAGSLLNWVLSPGFIKFSYTNPANNPVIETGLGVTRGFVNMLLVLVLVYIAIATILRLAGYETKKLLVTFIIVALLVNFAPVICGLIVDASNIVMNFFVQDLKADAFGKFMGRKVSGLSSGFDEESDWDKIWQIVIQLAVMVPFLFVLTFILLLFTLIFILRYVVIWLLVILAPLAFVCYILPVTKKYFKMWWEQFLAWSFIGVTCGFFLYLGLLMVMYIKNDPSTVPVLTTGTGGLFDSILPYFVSVVFLGIGFVFGLKTSAIGAKVVVQGAKRGGKAAVKTTEDKTYRGIKAGAGAVRQEARGIRDAYRTGREGGLTRIQSTKETARVYWQKRIRPSAAPITIAGRQVAPGGWPAQIVRGIAAPIRMTAAAGRGVLSAAKDVAVAGTAAAFKIKSKKGIKKCPACGNTKVAKSAKSCPSCGYDFE